METTIDLLQIKIEKAKSNLSDDTLNAIAAVPWKDTITQMRERDGFTFEQLGDLELETELLLCGLLSPVDYPKELEKRMGISKATANSLTEEMNKLVFEKIKEELIKTTERKKMFAKRDIHPGASATPQEGNNHDTEEQKIKNTEVLKSHGIEIIPEAPKLVPPRLTEEGVGGGNSQLKSPPRPLGTPPPQGGEGMLIPEKLELSTPAKATPQEGNNTIHPALAQKMSASVQAPIVKTEHTLENITKTVPPASIPTKPKIDPYREIPE
jgi:hypothetical protein